MSSIVRIGAVVVLLALIVVVCGDDLEDCFPLESTQSTPASNGRAEASSSAHQAVPCCTLSPFDRICSHKGKQDGEIVVSSSVLSAIPGLNTTAPLESRRPLGIRGDLLTTSPSPVPVPTITISPNNPQQSVNITTGNLNYFGFYSLQQWPFADLVHAGFVVTTSLGDGRVHRCELRQLVGNVGPAIPFQENECVNLCRPGVMCSSFQYCIRPIERDDNYISYWFGIRIKHRYYELGYMTTSNDGSTQYDFGVSISNDCLNPDPNQKNGTAPPTGGSTFVPLQYATHGSVEIFANVNDGSYDIKVIEAYFSTGSKGTVVQNVVLHTHEPPPNIVIKPK